MQSERRCFLGETRAHAGRAELAHNRAVLLHVAAVVAPARYRWSTSVTGFWATSELLVGRAVVGPEMESRKVEGIPQRLRESFPSRSNVSSYGLPTEASPWLGCFHQAEKECDSSS